MNRAILLVFALALVGAIGITASDPVSVEAQAKGRRKVDDLKEFRAIIMAKDAKMADRVKAVEAFPAIESAPTARGLGNIYVEIVTKEGASDVTNAIREKLRGISHEQTLIDLRDDVRDYGKVDDDLRGDWLRAQFGLKTEDADKFIVECAGDKLPSIRMFSAIGIGIRRIPDGYLTLTELTRDTSGWRVKSAAIGSLVAFVKMNRTQYLNTTVEVLMDTLEREKGGIQLDVIAALTEITGQDLGNDVQLWWSWYREFRKDSAKAGESRENRPSKSRNPYGIPTFSKQLIFIIDTSSSMKEPVDLEEIGPITGKGRDKDGEESDPDTDWSTVKTRLDLARAELIRTIRRLEPGTWFTIILYSTKVTVWKPEIVEATEKVKNEAIAMLKGLETTKLTNIYGALDEALKIAEKAIEKAEEAAKKEAAKRPSATGGRSGTREVELEARVPDTIYFLSDGFATTGEFKGPDIVGAATPAQAKEYGDQMTAMLKRIYERNEKSRMRINVIGIGKDHDNVTLPKLAAQNRGTYVAIGDPRNQKKKK